MTLRSLMLAALAIAGAAPASAMQLVSIHGIEIDADSYVSGFKIDTSGVDILAVCSLPKAWTIAAGHGIDASGELTGSASGPEADLRYQQLDALVDLFLIGDPPPGAPQSARFKGTITVGTLKAPGAERDVDLAPANIVLTPASQCPRPVPHSTEAR